MSAGLGVEALCKLIDVFPIEQGEYHISGMRQHSNWCFVTEWAVFLSTTCARNTSEGLMLTNGLLLYVRRWKLERKQV